ncbi:MAG: hypothetical protein SF123_15630 [Chloroflexota bacterium]|nr:hypothetical protein [Chloroflexota bacterium]
MLPSQDTTTLGFNATLDTRVTGRYRTFDATFALHLRYNTAGGYEFRFAPDGTAALYRNQRPLQIASVGSMTSSWVDFDASVIGSRIRLVVQGMTIIDYTDAEPLFPGVVAMRGGDYFGYTLLDSLSIYGVALTEPGEGGSITRIQPTRRDATYIPFSDQLSFTSYQLNGGGGQPVTSVYLADGNGNTAWVNTGNHLDFAPSGNEVILNGPVRIRFLPAPWFVTDWQLWRRFPDLSAASCPDWSPDGSSIAVRLLFGYPTVTRTELWLSGIPGAEESIAPESILSRMLVNDPAITWVGCPVWSPDGSRMALNVKYGYRPDIVLLDRLGNVTRLTDNDADERVPVWSPTGQQIAYEVYREYPERRYVVEIIDLANPGQSFTLTPGDVNTSDTGPTFSPDGSQIAVSRFSRTGGPSGIVIQPLLPTFNPNAAAFVAGTSLNDQNPAWSLNGGWIATTNNGSVRAYSLTGGQMVGYGNVGLGPASLKWGPPNSALAATPTPTPTPTATPVPTQTPTPTATQISVSNEIVVNTLSQNALTDADCTLTDAILAANTDTTIRACIAVNSSEPDRITFSVQGVLTLTSPYENGDTALPPIQASMEINGNGAITIERTAAAPMFRILSIEMGANLTLNGVTIQGGQTTTEGGGIYNLGTLIITNSTVRNNWSGLTGLQPVGYGIGTGIGGGIRNVGSLSIINSNIYANRADNFGGGIHNSGNLSVQGSRIERNVAVNTLIDARHTGFLTNRGIALPGGRLDSAGGGIYHTGTGVAQVTGSCIGLNTARNGGGIFAEGTQGFTATGNWWGHPDGATNVDIAGRQGALGDVITGPAINSSSPLSSPPVLAVPLLGNVTFQGCFQIDEMLSSADNRTGWGRADLALEVYIRASDLIGRDVQLGEMIAIVVYVASSQGQGFDERELNIFTEASGRLYYEYNQGNRGLGATSCPDIFLENQRRYLARTDLGFLCTFGSLSEWYGELDSAEYQALFIADAIRLTALNQTTSSGGSLTWLSRGNWINEPANRVLGREIADCRSWEVGLNREGSDAYNENLDVRGCPWVWGNQTVLYTNPWAASRLSNTQVPPASIQPSNNTLVQRDSGPAYRVVPGSPYVANPDSNIEFSAISARLAMQNPFYMFTIAQITVLRCSSPLVAVADPGVAAGYYPSCRPS